MDCSFSYSEHINFPVYMENPMDVSTDHMIDPNLATPPQVLRYLTENNKSSFSGYSVVAPGFPGSIIRRDDGMAPLLSGFQRRDSPSFSHTSSASSSAFSPPGEGDYYHGQSPPTPTDTTIMSPYFRHCDSMSSSSQLCQFTGLAEDCVKPIDINLFQEAESYCDDNIPRLDFPSRGYSMSSDDSGIPTDMCTGREQVGLARPMSPEGHTPDVKEEIRIPESIDDYPTLESDDEMMSSEEAENFNIKHEDVEDDEYKPSQKQRRTKPTAGRHTRNRKRRNSSGPPPEAKRPKIEPDDSPTMSRPPVKPVIQGTKGNFFCSKCSKKATFKDENGLQNHIRKQHTRPFICVFGFAGCTSTFASKNEWKRHCSSQHLVLNYWICQQDQCSRASSKVSSPIRNRPNVPYSHSPCLPALPRGTIFNRKDLYTQHLRRMHIPSNLKKQVKQRKPVPEWESREREHQDEAKRTRCNLPSHMRCPAFDCKARFDGPNAWDDRMEHVAKHLEKAVTGLEPPIEFGGEHDTTLIEWATHADVAIIERGEKGNWKLRNPLKCGGGVISETHTDLEGDEDAEGEEIDE
ncbi:hypothetical protein GGS26DRAFT_364742 [Hypomontagnella submonticulosa]|nr:hypothetical protein GGS26DRAFT_364742 [Hypomontagnella submonticulosa]